MIFHIARSLAYLAAQSVEAVVARASWFPAADELWDSAGVRAAAERLAEKEAAEEVSEPREDGPRIYMNGVEIDVPPSWLVNVPDTLYKRTEVHGVAGGDGDTNGHTAPGVPLDCLPWSVADLSDDWWLKGALPGLVLDKWGVEIGRFDNIAHAEAVVTIVNASSAVPPAEESPATDALAAHDGAGHLTCTQPDVDHPNLYPTDLYAAADVIDAALKSGQLGSPREGYFDEVYERLKAAADALK